MLEYETMIMEFKPTSYIAIYQSKYNYLVYYIVWILVIEMVFCVEVFIGIREVFIGIREALIILKLSIWLKQRTLGKTLHQIKSGHT